MAAFDLVSNISDVRLKPRLLRSLLIERVPDEKHPFQNPSELSHVVFLIKTHGLLSESSPPPINQKQVDDWKSAVDAWVERLLALISSNMPDKCWAGICLLGLTCQECSSDRFLSSYSVWFNRLLSHIQPPADSHLVKVGSCVSIADLFTRLGGFPNVKKDGNSHAGKLIQPVLKLLSDDITEAVWEGAVQLLCTLLNLFPSSIHRHYDYTETVIASKIMSGKCSDNMLERLAHCLALLPRSRGDEDSWSMTMRKILFMVNDYLNDAFQGLEDEEPSKEALRLLVPPGKDPPPPLGGQTLSVEASNQARIRSERLLISSVLSLMHCCSTMLTSSYPMKVTVPIRPLLALIERVLMVDGSLSPSRYSSFVTTMQQESICSELPILHSSSLDLLIAIIKGLRSQLLPHAACIVRVLTLYFKRCAFPNLRIKVYSITKILLMSMGVGIAIYLAQEVINNVLVDLNPVGQENGGTSGAFVNASSGTLLQPSRRKRKHITSAGSAEQHDRVGLELEAPKKYMMSPVAVKIAALEALETLLTVGGALGSTSWRPNVDLLLITIATNSFEGEWSIMEKNTSSANESSSIWTAFQLAAFRALLASLLSPARIRPPYLAQSLELFRRGRQESGTELAQFCAHALLALEVLIHPRALPLMDFPSADGDSFGVNDRSMEYAYSSGEKHSTPFSSGMQGMGHDVLDSDDDDLYKKWVGNGDETEAPVTDPYKNTSHTEELPKTLRDHQAEKASVDGPSGTKNSERSQQDPPVAITDMRKGMRDDADEIMIESNQFQESTAQFEEPLSSKGVTAPAILSGSETDALHHKDRKMAHGENVLAAKGNVTTATNPFNAISNIKKSKGSDVESDNESFPDIVDVDPDSD